LTTKELQRRLVREYNRLYKQSTSLLGHGRLSATIETVIDAVNNNLLEYKLVGVTAAAVAAAVRIIYFLRDFYV
jgi:hypothetical protein